MSIETSRLHWVMLHRPGRWHTCSLDGGLMREGPGQVWPGWAWPVCHSKKTEHTVHTLSHNLLVA